MSRWTHIAGIFRIDGIRTSEPSELNKLDNFKKEIKEVLGPIIRFGDSAEIWNKGTKLPIGGPEGSLEYDILINHNEPSVAVAVVPVWGDFRDFEDFLEISDVENWFNSVCKKLWIRQAIVEIQDEWGENSKVLIYKDKEGE